MSDLVWWSGKIIVTAFAVRFFLFHRYESLSLLDSINLFRFSISNIGADSS